jgi:isopenicillin-N epimerase
MEFLHVDMTPAEAEEQTYITRLLIDLAPTTGASDVTPSGSADAGVPPTLSRCAVREQTRHAALAQCAALAEKGFTQGSGESQRVEAMDVDDRRPLDELGAAAGARLGAFEPPTSEDGGVCVMLGVAMQRTALGRELKEKHFLLLQEAAFLNSGSYGATPQIVLRAADFFEDVRGADPAAWPAFLSGRYDAICSRLAKFVGAPASSLALLTNCNEATSTVLKTMPWQVGSRLMLLSCDYEATFMAARWLAARRGVVVDIVPISLPGSSADILSCIDAHLQVCRRIGTVPQVANFCHVTSKTGFVFPVAAMTELCHRYDVAVIVDGAQAPGHIPVDIAAINAEFYLGTCHKWMFSCQGVAFLAAAPRAQSLVAPLAPLQGTSASGTTYYEQFKMCACPINAPLWLSLWYSFEFVERVCGGWQAIYDYNQKLATEAVTMLCDMWRLNDEDLAVRFLQDVEGLQRDKNSHHRETYRHEQAQVSCMPVVPLPRSRGCTPADAIKVMGYLLTKFNVTAFLLVVDFPTTAGDRVDMLAVRLTLHAHTSLDDVFHLGRAVKELNGLYGTLSVFKEYLPQVT